MKLVLTGAAGRPGSYLREALSKLATEFVSTDIVDDIGKLYEGETYIEADLAEKILAETGPLDPQNPGHMCHGGPFASVPLGEGATASTGILNDKKKT